MTPDQIRAAMTLYNISSARQLAKQTGLNHQSLCRWIAGTRPIPNHAEIILRQFFQIKRLQKEIDQAFDGFTGKDHSLIINQKK